MLLKLVSVFGKFKLQYFLVISIIALGGFSMWALGEIKFQKSEKFRERDNFHNSRDMDSLKIALFTFRTTEEIEDYVDTNKELSDMLDEQKIKNRKLQNIIFQKQTYIDNVIRATDVSSMVEDIRKGVSSTAQWKDSTECLTIKGDVTYQNDSLEVNVNERKFDNTILITGSWKRKPSNFFARVLGLGRKVASAKATSKCGESETIIIKRQEK